MRKPRDIDAELQALAKKAKDLKSRKVTQLGELVIATGAEALTTEVLVGALLAAQGAPASGVGVPGSGSASGWRPVARPAAGGAPEGPSQGEGSVVEPVDGPPPSGPVPGSWFREARGAASEDGAD